MPANVSTSWGRMDVIMESPSLSSLPHGTDREPIMVVELSWLSLRDNQCFPTFRSTFLGLQLQPKESYYKNIPVIASVSWHLEITAFSVSLSLFSFNFFLIDNSRPQLKAPWSQWKCSFPRRNEIYETPPAAVTAGSILRTSSPHAPRDIWKTSHLPNMWAL